MKRFGSEVGVVPYSFTCSAGIYLMGRAFTQVKYFEIIGLTTLLEHRMVINEKLIPEMNVREYRNELVREILQKNLTA